MKKKTIILGLIASMGAAAIILGFTPPTFVPDVPLQVTSLEQSPPYVEKIWVQRLQAPINGCEMAMRIQMDTSVIYNPVTDTLNLFYGGTGGARITFSDRGVGADNYAHDGIYSAYIPQNASAFAGQIANILMDYSTVPSYLTFKGHTGTVNTTPPFFDIAAFSSFAEMELPRDIGVLAVPCNFIKKQNSLLITDLNVVEDPARTYNPVAAGGTGSGNPNGIWTFGSMIRGMAGGHITPKALLASWIRHWTVTFTLNGQIVRERKAVYNLLIEPWLRKAGSPPAVALDASNWETAFMAADEDALLENAPFKLTAIVNRLDLRGNSAYGASLSNSGETRFIFSLINPDGFAPGEVPVQQDMSFSASSDNFLDWRGLNVIFEYGNVQNTICDAKNFAQQWVDLSYQTLGSTGYLMALEALTTDVLTQNVKPGRPNGSALLRMRTNERIFFEPSTDAFAMDPVSGHSRDKSWHNSAWQFRQFEISAGTHEFTQVPLPNVPSVYANSVPYNLSCAVSGPLVLNGEAAPTALSGVAGRLYNWVSDPMAFKTILNGNHNIPTTYPTTSDPLLEGQGNNEAGHPLYYAIPWPISYEGLDGAPYYKIRHEISLNTCQGCHAGETKTLFTQVSPMGYGETANYWGTIPDNKVGNIDTRQCRNLYYYTPPTRNSYYQNVSAFLTGRRYSGVSGSGSFDDDDPSDPDDNNMDGLFYVSDPNNNTIFTNHNDTKYGYNDLARRSADLCRLANSTCTFSALDFASKLFFVPMPFAAH